MAVERRLPGAGEALAAAVLGVDHEAADGRESVLASRDQS